MNLWTAGQYTLFRVVLGAYLAVHFAGLLPWCIEVFSAGGMLPEAGLSPLFSAWPNLLMLGDSPAIVLAVVASGAGASLALAAGWHDRTAAIWLWVVLMGLICRNPLMSNPALPYVGWLLIAHCFVPRTPYSLGRERPDVFAWGAPQAVFAAAAVVLAISYTYSGWTKALSPTWMAGDTVAVVLENPLARDWLLRDLTLALPPWLLEGITLAVLWIELLYAPLFLARRLRFALWASMLAVQFGFLALLNFPDLTTPMLIMHLLCFDPAWTRRGVGAAKATVYYDGACGFCQGVVRFALGEDPDGRLSYLPLQSAQAEARLGTRFDGGARDATFVLEDGSGRRLTRSDAVVRLLLHLGGLWWAVAALLWLVPRPLRDAGYGLVGRWRLALAGRRETLCPVLPPTYRARFPAL